MGLRMLRHRKINSANGQGKARAVGGTQGELDLNTALIRLAIPVVVMGPKLAMGR